MFAINHAATALLVKRRYPEISLPLLLLAVQAVEFLWVALNYVGVERTTTEAKVDYVGDIHLYYMPFSHSVGTTILLGASVFFLARVAGRPRLAAALALGLGSHIVLDLLTHNGDIALAPFVEGHTYGTYLYALAPTVAFLLELFYGIACWWVYRGRGSLLAVILLFNLANASFFFRAVPGPEQWLAGKPTLIVTLILSQIVLTLLAVGWTARRRAARPWVAPNPFHEKAT